MLFLIMIPDNSKAKNAFADNVFLIIFPYVAFPDDDS